MLQPTDTDWAYAAGFVDGEGCIAVVRSSVKSTGGHQYRVFVDVANRDRAVLEWMRSLWGGWVVGKRQRMPGAQPMWIWRSPTGVEAKPFLVGIRPWLRLKSKQCDNAVTIIAVVQERRRTHGRTVQPVAWSSKLETLYWIQRRLNHRGRADFVRQPRRQFDLTAMRG